MSPQSFLVIWAIAFASLCLALLLLSWFYYLLASEIELHAVSKEVRICLIISFLQALNYVAAEALITESPRARVAIGLAFGGIILHLAHLGKWNGGESVGIFFFQFLILVICRLLILGQFKLALIVAFCCLCVLGAFCAFIRSIF